MVAFWLLNGSAFGAPMRLPANRPEEVVWEEGLQRDVLIIKLEERLSGKMDGAELSSWLMGAEPLFSTEVRRRAEQTHRLHPELADLSLYFRLHSDDAVEVGTQLLSDARIETVYLEMAPTPPPFDLRPPTPDFSDGQSYLGAAPDGMGILEARSWPGGLGENVTIADLEYGWETLHEDLGAARGAGTWGWNSGYYAYHGTSVLGILVGGDNGYGVQGIAPEATPLVISPYNDEQIYNVAESVAAAGLFLDAGDVLLIEQQGYLNGNYCPVEATSAVFDAITHLVVNGIVVVEPGGNGGQNLDAEVWDGWFDPSLRDSGAIMVGGGASPDSPLTTRAWFPGGSSYGQRVDVQGWFDGITTATNAELGGSQADLFFPDDDTLQAYTESFGGTSGASAQIAGLVALINSIAEETWGEPWDPISLRAALIQSGTPQMDESLAHIGPQPDLRRFLRTWANR